jgi:V8-like Glu-specific endopeptidase
MALVLGAAASADTPEQLFSADASGMVKVTVSCPTTKGTDQGSGFLLGPTLIMTARHVMVDPESGRNCTGTVVQEGTRTHARIVRWMAIGTKAKAATDLALAVLSTPLTGHYFSISRVSPKPHALVVILGYALGQPLSLNQGHVSKLTTNNHVRLIEMAVLEAGGASGGPILDATGDVVGVDQFGGSGLAATVDLARLAHNDPGSFCFGVATGQNATICSAGTHGAPVLAEDGPPQTCVGIALDLPFENGCPMYADDLRGMVQLTSKCPKTWLGTGFLLGPRLVMTARSELIDPDTGAQCTTTVLPFGSLKPVRVEKWMAVQVPDPLTSTDVAIAVLATPVKGYYFMLGATSPKAGQILHSLTRLYPLPSSHNKARVVKGIKANGIRVLELSGGLQDGGGGGPIVDASNEVVGVAQWGSTTKTLGIDLPRLTQGDPTHLCFGDAKGLPSSICPALAGAPVVLAQDAPVQICNGHAAVPPYTTCPAVVSDCWLSSADSADKTLTVTQLADTDTTGVYFMQQLAYQPSNGTTLAVNVKTPAGTVDALAFGPVPETKSQTPLLVAGPLRLDKLAATFNDGTYTVTVTASDGSNCSATVAVGPG